MLIISEVLGNSPSAALSSAPTLLELCKWDSSAFILLLICLERSGKQGGKVPASPLACTSQEVWSCAALLPPPFERSTERTSDHSRAVGAVAEWGWLRCWEEIAWSWAKKWLKICKLQIWLWAHREYF